LLFHQKCRRRVPLYVRLPYVRDLREVMWTRLEQTTGCNRHEFASKEEKLNALIGEKYQPSEKERVKDVYRNLVKSVMTYITRAMNRRRRFLARKVE